MRQIRIAKHRPRSPSGRDELLPLDPRDPDIVHAHRASDTRAGRTEHGERARTKPDRGGR